MSRKIFLLSSTFVFRASVAAILGAGCLAGTASAMPEDTFPQAATKAEILRWLAGNSDLTPDSVVTMTDEVVVAVTSREDGRGVGRSTRLTLREEVINPDAAAAWGGRSIQLDLDLDCARHRVILGTRRLYARPNLQGSAHITRSDNAWSEVPPDTVIDDVARAACSPKNPAQIAEAAPAPHASDSATVAAAAEPPPASQPPAPQSPAPQSPARESAPAAPAPVQLAEAAPPASPVQEPAPAPKTVHAPAEQEPAAQRSAPEPAPGPVQVAEAVPAPSVQEAPAPVASAPAPETGRAPAPSKPVAQARAAKAKTSKTPVGKTPAPPPAQTAAVESAPPPSPPAPEAAPAPVQLAEAAPVRPAQPVEVAAADPLPPPAAPVTVAAPPAAAVAVVPTETAAPPQVQAAPPQAEPPQGDQSVVVHNPFVVAEADKAPAAPAASAPSPRPAAAAAQAPRGADVAVQIAAVASADLAHDSWQALKAKLPSLVAPLTFAVEPVDANGRTLYRALLLGFATPEEASTLCKTLRSQSVDCILRQMR